MHSGVGQQRLEKASEVPVGCHQESAVLQMSTDFIPRLLVMTTGEHAVCFYVRFVPLFSLSLKEGKNKTKPMFTFSDNSLYVMQ